MDLKGDIRSALDTNSEYDLPESVTVAVLAAVLPHFEPAYKRGIDEQLLRILFAPRAGDQAA